MNIFYISTVLLFLATCVASNHETVGDKIYTSGSNSIMERLIYDSGKITDKKGIFSENLDSILYSSIQKYFTSDLKESVANLKKLAEDGDSMANFFLGMLHYYGIGVERNIPQSLIYNEFANNEFSEIVTMNQIESGDVTPPSCSYALRIHRSIFDKNKNNIQILFTESPKVPLLTDVHDLEFIREHYIFDVNKHHFILQSGISGDPNLLIELGKRYLIGDILHSNDYDKAIEMFQLARDAGSPHANSLIGLAYTLKYYITQDLSYYTKAFEIFDKEMIDNTSPIAYLGFSIAKYLRSSEITEEEKSAAFDLLQKANGFSKKWVDFLYGIFYLEGFGVQPDHHKAMKYIESALHKFNIPAAAYLARLNDYGIGTFEDCNVAIKLYNIVLNVMLFRNAKIRAYDQIINGDPKVAFYMMLTLSYFGDAESHYNVAALLESGYLKIADKPTQDAMIFRFYSLATNKYVKEAWEKIGDCYYYGLGVEKDYIEAKSAYKNGIDYLSSRSAFNVGLMYQSGVEGIERDINRAQLYFDKAILLNPLAYYPIKFWCLQITVMQWFNSIVQNFVKFFVEYQFLRVYDMFLHIANLALVDKMIFCFTLLVSIFWIHAYRNRISF